MHGSCVSFWCVSLSPWGSGSLCADTLAAHPDDFAPFCEYQNDDNLNDHNDNDPYQTYVSNVRTSAEWGGHLELRALAVALHRPILIYQAHTPDPLEITPSSSGDATPAAVGDEPIRLSYHRHYYALGEHYNQVVMASEEGEAEQEEEEPQS
jgi:OTU domain-containing protein 6